MKDIKIKAKQIKKELLILLVCLLAAIGLNIYSIIKYNTDWSELIGQLHIVILVAVLLYVLVGMFRLFAWGVNRIFQKK
ncbi:MAG: hypothetical protein R3182_10930 [Draconibacterium sp.]|nr:hypothetical protein [Draconibacterium sp.]